MGSPLGRGEHEGRSPSSLRPESGAQFAPRRPPASVAVLVDIDRRKRKCGHERSLDVCGLVLDVEAGTARPCAPCIAWRRKVQYRDYWGEQEDVEPASRFVRWHLPHHGREELDCGRAVFFAHDHVEGAHYWAFNLPCKRRSCRKCAPVFNDKGELEKAGAWEARIARQWQAELAFWLGSEEAHALAVHTNQRRVPVVHLVVSVPPSDWDELAPNEKTRELLGDIRGAAHRRIQAVGVHGAFWVQHGLRVPGRWNQRVCAEPGLHYHYIGVTDRRHGLVDGAAVRRLHARSGWVVKRLRDWRKRPFQTMLYQLSHATYPEFNDDLGGPEEDDGAASLYPAPKHNSQFGRSCGRIGTFLGLAGLAPSPPEPEDICPVCEQIVAPSQRFEVYRLGDAPPPAAFGVVDWSLWSDTPAQAPPPQPVIAAPPPRCPGCGAAAPLKDCASCGGWHCRSCKADWPSCIWNW